jgi:hypothetical protein
MVPKNLLPKSHIPFLVRKMSWTCWTGIIGTLWLGQQKRRQWRPSWGPLSYHLPPAQQLSAALESKILVSFKVLHCQLLTFKCCWVPIVSRPPSSFPQSFQGDSMAKTRWPVLVHNIAVNTSVHLSVEPSHSSTTAENEFLIYAGFWN